MPKLAVGWLEISASTVLTCSTDGKENWRSSSVRATKDGTVSRFFPGYKHTKLSAPSADDHEMQEKTIRMRHGVERCLFEYPPN